MITNRCSPVLDQVPQMLAMKRDTDIGVANAKPSKCVTANQPTGRNRDKTVAADWQLGSQVRMTTFRVIRSTVVAELHTAGVPERSRIVNRNDKRPCTLGYGTYLKPHTAVWDRRGSTGTTKLAITGICDLCCRRSTLYPKRNAVRASVGDTTGLRWHAVILRLSRFNRPKPEKCCKEKA